MALSTNKKHALISGAFGLITFICLSLLLSSKVGTKQGDDSSVTEAPKNEYVFFAKAVKKGAVIKDDDVEVKNSKVEIDGAYKTKAEVVGMTAAQDVAAEKPAIKTFIKKIQVVSPSDTEPTPGFRAIPLLIKKSTLPPYLSLDQRFDLVTKEANMKIENLKILSILDPSKNSENKMLILEIKDSDVPKFIKYQMETQGFVFLQKSKNEFGEYKFYSYADPSSANSGSGSSIPSKMPEMGGIPTIPDIPQSIPNLTPDTKNTDIPVQKDDFMFNGGNKKEVEVIIGDQKTKVEFEE